MKTQLILRDLLEHSLNGKLPKGLVKHISAKFEVSSRTVHRIWEKKKTSDKEGKILDLTDQRRNNGREPIYSVELIQAANKALPINRRGTLEGVAFELGIGERAIRR